ncbi:uncharacterized protein LOC131648916 [Vicia villosa]|uniref:uncharacterized protein LOC131648916 n=1 Tax=Vicia villosa TaxID=3911 RepID=UPI00273AF3BC|nr:uncharacterized protein LOC131648916 [Vicia villosa]
MNDVDWKSLLIGNTTRRRAKIILWLACHGRLATKDRLMKIGVIKEENCKFCDDRETLQHLMFECSGTKGIWGAVLDWLHIDKVVHGWGPSERLGYKICKSKSWRRHFFKVALAETVYAVWCSRNSKVYCKRNLDRNIVDQIIENIVNRVLGIPKLREKLAILLM